MRSPEIQGPGFKLIRYNDLTGVYVVREKDPGCKQLTVCLCETMNLSSFISLYWAGHLLAEYPACVPCFLRLVKRARKILH
jgi:hypothetical protein